MTKRKPDGYWNQNNCKKTISKYKTFEQFKKNNESCYVILSNKGWGHLLLPLKRNQKPKNFWNKKECSKEALKYKSKKEFAKKSSSAYSVAVKNKWIIDICKHMPTIGNLYFRCVYVFEFSDKTCYVGLTGNTKKRFNQHIKTNKTSSVYIYSKKTNLKPIFKIISEYLPVKKAAKLENKIIKQYKKEGFILLNKQPGGGLGAGIRKWNKELLLKEAKKYKTKKEFKQHNPQAYLSAYQKGYLKTFKFLKRSNGAIHKRKKVNQYTIDGKFIKTWISITKAAKKYNTQICNISSICKNKHGHKTAGGYVWKYVT